MREFFLSIAGILLLLPAWTAAQEIVYDEPIQLSPDSLDTDNPQVVFNGKEHGVLYYMEKVNDDFGLFFQRLDVNGKPISPPKKVFDYQGYRNHWNYFSVIEPFAGVWDGEAYVFVASEWAHNRYYLLRISPGGELIKKRTINKNPYAYLGSYYRFRLFRIGEKMFFFFNLYDLGLWERPHLMQFDRHLTGPVSIKAISTGKHRRQRLFGAAHDGNKFVLLIADGASYSEPEWHSVKIAHVDFNGKVTKKSSVLPYLLSIPPSKPASVGNEYYEIYDLSGPVYVGDGFVAAASMYNFLLNENHAPPPSGYQLPYTNNSFKFDEDGKMIGKPFNLGHTPYPYNLRRSTFCGNHAAFIANYWDDLVILVGKKGGHIGNANYEEREEYHQSDSTETSVAYTGFACTVVYNQDRATIILPPEVTDRTDPIYCNQYKMPKFTKPGFLYFQAGTAEPVANHRLVMWSVVAGKNVTLKGPDFEMTDLPPVWSYLVDTKGQETKLVLSFTTEDGKTKKKRLVIEP